ncbi:MAG: HipA domain-containing protein [Actinomycetota bacterium]
MIEFREVDVSMWGRAHEETLGTKPKRWLHDPVADEFWLMKDVTFNRRADGTTYAKGDDWAERVAGAVAEALGLPAAVVELATGGPGADTSVGVISRSLLSTDESLVHGNELLAEIGVSGDDPHDRTGYTLDAVRQVLERVDAPPASELTAWETFVGFLVLDALVGNTDRHQENWAVIARGGDRRLAPTFDHASSLGFQLDDEQRSERLSTADANRTPEAYAGKARTRFEGSPPPLAVAVDGLATLAPEKRDHWFDRSADVEKLLAPLGRVPAGRISESARSFAARLLQANHSQLMSHRVGTV